MVTHPSEFEPIRKTIKSYEHQHFGPFINVIAIVPGYPIAWTAWAKLYLFHESPASAIAHWQTLNRKKTERTVFANVYGTMGKEKKPGLISKRIIELMGQKSNKYVCKYNHVILCPPNDTVHKYIPNDYEMVELFKGLIPFFRNPDEVHIYEHIPDTEIDPEDMPVTPNGKNWYAWRLMFSFLNQLEWPMSQAYALAKEEGWSIVDTQVHTRLELP